MFDLMTAMAILVGDVDCGDLEDGIRESLVMIGKHLEIWESGCDWMPPAAEYGYDQMVVRAMRTRLQESPTLPRLWEGSRWWIPSDDLRDQIDRAADWERRLTALEDLEPWNHQTIQEAVRHCQWAADVYRSVVHSRLAIGIWGKRKALKLLKDQVGEEAWWRGALPGPKPDWVRE